MADPTSVILADIAPKVSDGDGDGAAGAGVADVEGANADGADSDGPGWEAGADESEFRDETTKRKRPGLVAGADESEMMDETTKRKRLCRYPGCTKVIKSQGHCQRHGAKAKRCKVDGCDKQAQGTHEGMCKRHWKSIHFPDTQAIKQEAQPPPPEGESVYDGVLPQSISYRPSILANSKGGPPETKPGEDPPPAPGGVSVMPLVAFLREGAPRELGWHRNSERRARGLFPVSSLSAQLEPWERQLALVEILLLSGGTPYANFKDLAHAWGREKGFHHVLAGNVCDRRGEVERKRRSDAGKTLSSEQRESFRQKLKRSRSSSSVSDSASGSDEPGPNTMTAPTTMEVEEGDVKQEVTV